MLIKRLRLKQKQFVQVTGRLVLSVIRHALRSSVRTGIDQSRFLVAVCGRDDRFGAFLTFEIDDNSAVENARKALVNAIRGAFAEAAVRNRDDAVSFVRRVGAELNDVVLYARIPVHRGRKKQNIGVRFLSRFGDHDGLSADLDGRLLYQIAVPNDYVIVTVNGGHKAFSGFLGVLAKFVESLVRFLGKALVVGKSGATRSGQTVRREKIYVGFVFVHDLYHPVGVAERSSDGNDEGRCQYFHEIILSAVAKNAPAVSSVSFCFCRSIIQHSRGAVNRRRETI